MVEHPSLLEADDIVLPTMNKDGSRRWIRPKLSTGKFLQWRTIVGWALIIIFVSIPHLRFHGKPLILLDVAKRQFTFFGVTFLATDVALLLLLLLGIFLSIFLLTALFGRVWCGWGCPQTVYMELLFRPIERWFEGSPKAQQKRDENGADGRRIMKNIVFFIIAIFLGNTFLSYFVGTDQLWIWVRQSPFAHPTPFAIMLFVSCAVYFDFGYFREQTCLVACPYGRFQSVLLDKDSLIVGYDPGRGEPRAKGKARKSETPEGVEEWGDCIDCKLCVATCPTGIDIRDGLQMECINCTQCIDACDAVMTKIGKPTGLIRYSSQNELKNQGKSLLRARTVLYPLLILVVFSVLGFVLWSRTDAEIRVRRGGSAPYTTQGDKVAGQVVIRIANRTYQTRNYKIKLIPPKGSTGVTMIAPNNPVTVKGSLTGKSILYVVSPSKNFKKGRLKVQFAVEEVGGTYRGKASHILLGPDD